MQDSTQLLHRIRRRVTARLRAEFGGIQPGRAEEIGAGPHIVANSTYKGPTPDYADLSNPLEQYFWNNKNRLVDKWHHYLPIYDRYFARFRRKPIKMLEIGVSQGGSLHMWRNYFGKEALIFGIDIDPACEGLGDDAAEVRIGSQDDPDFLNSLVDEMGGVDIVLDDGSHVSNHIRQSFLTLYPRLSFGGVYMIEDLHTMYWSHFGGGYDEPHMFFQDLKAIVDDMHHWYHDHDVKIEAANNAVAGLHFHDSIAILEKEKMRAPARSQIGFERSATSGVR